jgi:hypothetical protein
MAYRSGELVQLSSRQGRHWRVNENHKNANECSASI